MFRGHLCGCRRPSKGKGTDRTRDNRKEMLSPLHFQLGLQKVEHKQGISEVHCFPSEFLNVYIHSAHGHYIWKHKIRACVMSGYLSPWGHDACVTCVF